MLLEGKFPNLRYIQIPNTQRYCYIPIFKMDPPNFKMHPFDRALLREQRVYDSRDFSYATPSSSSAANPGNSGNASYGFGAPSSSSYAGRNEANPGFVSRDFAYATPSASSDANPGNPGHASYGLDAPSSTSYDGSNDANSGFSLFDFASGRGSLNFAVDASPSDDSANNNPSPCFGFDPMAFAPDHGASSSSYGGNNNNAIPGVASHDFAYGPLSSSRNTIGTSSSNAGGNNKDANRDSEKSSSRTGNQPEHTAITSSTGAPDPPPNINTNHQAIYWHLNHHYQQQVEIEQGFTNISASTYDPSEVLDRQRQRKQKWDKVVESANQGEAKSRPLNDLERRIDFLKHMVRIQGNSKFFNSCSLFFFFFFFLIVINSLTYPRFHNRAFAFSYHAQ